MHCQVVKVRGWPSGQGGGKFPCGSRSTPWSRPELLQSELPADLMLGVLASPTRPRPPVQELPADLMLGGLRVVLVGPKTEGNIGAAARACGNFEAGG